MTESFSSERLALYDSALKKKSDIAYGRTWTLEPKSLRFKHGESITELKVPYHMGAEDEAVVEAALTSLAALIKKRFEPDEDESASGPAGIQKLFLNQPPLKDRTYLTDLFIAESFEKKLAHRILVSTPGIDSAILSSWLHPDAPGRNFIKWIDSIFEKSFKDEAKNGWEEPTSYLTLLAVVKTIQKKRDKIKGIRIKGLTYERMDLAVGLTVFTTFLESIKHLLERLRDSGASYYKERAATVLLSSVVPRSFLAIPGNLLSVSLNPYGINSETFEALLPYTMDFSEETPESAELLRVAAKKIKGNSKLTGAINELSDIIRFRSLALAYLMEFDAPGMDAHTMLMEMVGEDRLIRNLMNDSKTSANLVDALEKVKKKYSRDPRRMDALTELQRFLGSFKKSVLSGIFRGSSREGFDAVDHALRAYFACRFDDHVERFASLMRGYLADRRGEYEQKILQEEYSRGRLYRFSTDNRPIIKTLEVGEEGQLFVDMKDFTRKTLKVKEIAMADFMKEHFYKPILTAAGRYSIGSGIATDERGIWLTNLPGDAAIFSGGVAYLVSLARDIQRVIRRYRETLTLRLPPREEGELLEEVHRRFDEKRALLSRKRAELNEALNSGEQGVEQRLISLGEEEHRLENTYRDELEASIKGELEAGLYIAYGAKAESMIIDSEDSFSGASKVAIGEKINEASRGTYRHAMVRAKLEILLESERNRRGNKNLKYPFDIYIDRIYSLRMPPELEAPFEKLIATKKSSGAEAMTHIMSNAFLNDLKKIISGESFSMLKLITSTTDIYNKGEALSSEALEAYIRETKGTKFFFKKTVEVERLDKAIQDEFFFPSSQLEFWFGVEVIKGVEHVEAFYKSGELIFKGFEMHNPTVIYEMLNPEGGLIKALLKHHFNDWLDEAKSGGTPDSF